MRILLGGDENTGRRIESCGEGGGGGYQTGNPSLYWTSKEIFLMLSAGHVSEAIKRR